MVADALYVVPALLVLALGAYTTWVRDTFTACAAFLAYGLLLTIVWVQVGAVDVALTEAAIGAGLTSVLLVRAAARLRPTEHAAQATAPGGKQKLVAGALAAAIAIGLGYAVVQLPDPAPTLAQPTMAHLPATGVGNPITGVLMAFRAMDTMLEAIVVLLALVGIWSLAADERWGGRPGALYNADPDSILAFIARVLPPIGLVIGIYIFWTGADHPGGKFQGATIIAAMWLLARLAGLADTPPSGSRIARALLVAGPLVFLAVGVLGLRAAGAFLGYPEDGAKAMILVIEFALLPSLAFTLGLVMAGPPERGGPRG